MLLLMVLGKSIHMFFVIRIPTDFNGLTSTTSDPLIHIERTIRNIGMTIKVDVKDFEDDTFLTVP